MIPILLSAALVLAPLSTLLIEFAYLRLLNKVEPAGEVTLGRQVAEYYGKNDQKRKKTHDEERPTRYDIA